MLTPQSSSSVRGGCHAGAGRSVAQRVVGAVHARGLRSAEGGVEGVGNRDGGEDGRVGGGLFGDGYWIGNFKTSCSYVYNPILLLYRRTVHIYQPPYIEIAITITGAISWGLVPALLRKEKPLRILPRVTHVTQSRGRIYGILTVSG